MMLESWPPLEQAHWEGLLVAGTESVSRASNLRHDDEHVATSQTVLRVGQDYV